MVLIRPTLLMQSAAKGFLNISKVQIIPQHANKLQALLFRNVHMLRPIPGFELTTNDKSISFEKKGKQDGTKEKNLRLVNGSKSRPPLAVLLPWLMSKPKHIKKFSSFYLGHGFDVLSVRTTPGQILWPTKGSQLMANDLVTFLEVNPEYDQLVVHGFSVGGYIWGEVLVRLMDLGHSRASDKSGISPYDNVASRVRGCVWDSACDFTELPRGVAKAIFPNQAMLRNALESYANYHMKVFYDTATQHYIRASQLFHSATMRCPSLLLFSKSDPIGTAKANLTLYKEWTEFGMKVYTKCWDKSEHVAHYLNHPHEYIAQVTQFLETIGLIGMQQKDQARMKMSNV